MKVRHIKRRSHPVYDLRLLGWPSEAPPRGPDVPAYRARAVVFIEGLNLAEHRSVPPLGLERVRRTWSRRA